MPELKVAQLDESLDELQAIFQDFANRKGQFWKSLKNASILGAFRLWFKDHFDRPCLPEYASLLFEQDCLGFSNEIKIGEYNFKQVSNALGQIRCLMGPSIVESERLVELILCWLSSSGRYTNLEGFLDHGPYVHCLATAKQHQHQFENSRRYVRFRGRKSPPHSYTFDCFLERFQAF